MRNDGTENTRPVIDRYSYELGVMDCFCEMVGAGLKKLALSHPYRTREERDSYLPEVERLCRKYHIRYYLEDELLQTELFPEGAGKDRYLFLFFRTGEILEDYLGLKERQKQLIAEGKYDEAERRETAREFGRLLSYPEDGITRMMQKADESKNQ